MITRSFDDLLYLDVTKDIPCVCCGAPAEEHTFDDFYCGYSLCGLNVRLDRYSYKGIPLSDSVVSNVLCEECKDKLTRIKLINLYDETSYNYETSLVLSKLSLMKEITLALSQNSIPEDEKQEFYSAIKRDIGRITSQQISAVEGKPSFCIKLNPSSTIEIYSRYSMTQASIVNMSICEQVSNILHLYTGETRDLFMTTNKVSYLDQPASYSGNKEYKNAQFIAENLPKLYKKIYNQILLARE